MIGRGEWKGGWLRIESGEGRCKNTRMVFRAKAVVLWTALAWTCAGAAQEAGRARVDIPAAPVYSKDGSVTVYSPQSKAGYRMPVLSFVVQWRDDVQRMVRMKLPAQGVLLEVVIGGKSDGDTRVLAARVREPGGGVRERIELPDPEAADLSLLRRAIFAAMVRAWVAAGGGTSAAEAFPEWLAGGMVRHLERETRQEDVDRTLLLWSRACLPAAAELFAAQSAAGTREPAVAAVLGGWFFEKRQNAHPFDSLLKEAAAGASWSPALAAKILAGTEDLVAFDEYVDGRMLEEGRVVIQPGLTSGGIVRRFRSHLLLYPPYFGKFLGQNRSWCSLHEAALRADDPEVRRSAAAQARRVKLAAVGRDGMLSAVSEAYAAFLEAVARGAKQGELSQRLLEAEEMRGDLERRTARGELLRRTVGGA